MREKERMMEVDTEVRKLNVFPPTLMALAVSRDCSGGIPDSLSLSSCWMK